MEVFIGSDHAGFGLKEYLKAHIINITWRDQGTYDDSRANYSDFAHAVASQVAKNPESLGILVCGSANGVAMTANKHQSIRCAIAWTEELAKLSRQHNDANILALPARFISMDEGVKLAEAFLSTAFEGGRHQERVDGIPCR